MGINCTATCLQYGGGRREFACIAEGEQDKVTGGQQGFVHDAWSAHRRGALIEVMCSIASKDHPGSLANEGNEPPRASQLAGNWGLRCSVLAWPCERAM